jgi:hypothetical protein
MEGLLYSLSYQAGFILFDVVIPWQCTGTNKPNIKNNISPPTYVLTI